MKKRTLSFLLVLVMCLYLLPITALAAEPVAHASTQMVLLDGKPVELQAYALLDENGYPTNYVKLRDVAYLLNGTAAQFEVTWDGAVNIMTGQSYTANGSEMHTPFSGNRAYKVSANPTKVNGENVDMDAITLTDDNGGGYTYYKLRDLGAKLGFLVDWSTEKGIYIETDTVDPGLQEVYAKAESRKQNILSSATEIVKSNSFVQGETYTGTAYYVSNDGNDSNNGKSPETAWASLERLNRAQLKEGDAVFFRRGDTWYAGEKYWDNVLWYGCIRIRSGVTYSAYGEGEKPTFIGSMPGIAQHSKWVSAGTTADGGKLWRYVDKLHSVSGVLMNDGTVWSEMQLPGWNGKTYVNTDGSAFAVENSLTKDLTSFHALELAGRPADTVVEDEGLTGYLYLRCDKGNPGDVFDDIQFVAGGIGVGTEGEFGSNATVDNLSIQYFSQIGVSLGGYQGWENTLVQNCEIAYCGGITQAYVESGRFGYGKAAYSGGAIQMSGSGNRAVNNYIHGIDSKAFVVVIHDRGEKISTSYENLVMRGNLIENSGTALQVMSCLRDESSKRTGVFKNLVFDDNYVMHTGEGWFNCRLAALEEIYKEYGQLSALNFMGVKDGVIDNVQITNNVLCCADYALVAIKTTLNNYPTFSGNTYIQYAEERIAAIHSTAILAVDGAVEAIAKNFGDTQAKVLIER